MNNSYNHFDFSAIQTVVEKYRKTLEANPYVSDKVVFADHQEKFIKVAWDLWRLKDEPEVKIWQLGDPDAEGVQYISRITSFADEEQEDKSAWSAHADKEGKTVTVSYKKIPLAKLATEDFGVSAQDLSVFRKTIVDELRNKEKVKAFLGALDENFRNTILTSFPELA